MTPDIKSQTREELAARFRDWDQPPYRVDQLLHWLYVSKVVTWDEMTNLPRPLRQQLQGSCSLNVLELARRQGARDTTQKFLWRLNDGALVETVLIPANPALYGDPSDRHTLCISTQVGCAYGCKFCASGLEGWKRNLQPEEIIEQVIGVERWHGAQPRTDCEEEAPPGQASMPTPGPPAPDPVMPRRLINNLVVMGMGEPLANYENLLKALHILTAPWGGGIGARKITISTSGLVPQIRRLADEPLQFRLAVSLHGATDQVRSRIMPVNRRYPLRELIGACQYYRERKGRIITFEYILMAGVNDRVEDARSLSRLARRLHAKINLIPYNKVEGLPWERPSEAAQEAFLAVLRRDKVTATLRREKGHDIDAACGQLRLKTERQLQSLAAG